MEGSFRGVDRGIVVMPEKFLDEAEAHVCNMKQGTPADGDATARAIKALVKHLRWERRARYAEALHTVLVEMDPGYTEVALQRTGASTKDLLEGAHRLMRAVRERREEEEQDSND